MLWTIPALRFYSATSIITRFTLGALLLASPTLKAQVAPTTAINSLDQSSYFGFSISSYEWRGPTFQTGPADYKINELRFELFDEGSSIEPPPDQGEPPSPSPVTGTVTLSLYALNPLTNFPTSQLVSAPLDYSFPLEERVAIISFTASDLGAVGAYTLQANQKYALILSNPSSPISLGDNDYATNQYTFAAGFTAAGNGYVETSDSGTIWEDVDYTAIFQMSVIPASAASGDIRAVPSLTQTSLLLSIMTLLLAGGLTLRRKKS